MFHPGVVTLSDHFCYVYTYFSNILSLRYTSYLHGSFYICYVCLFFFRCLKNCKKIFRIHCFKVYFICRGFNDFARKFKVWKIFFSILLHADFEKMNIFTF